MRANHAEVRRQLSIARGQIEGIQKMVDEDAYCIDLLATIAMLKRLNVRVLSAHLEGCVKSASDENELDAKIQEVENILKRMSE